MINAGPYFPDQDGDTIIIGPGVHADAPEGADTVALFAELIHESVGAFGICDEEADEALDRALDLVLKLMNLAYSEGAKAGK
jgi:hypothetical protein